MPTVDYVKAGSGFRRQGPIIVLVAFAVVVVLVLFVVGSIGAANTAYAQATSSGLTYEETNHNAEAIAEYQRYLLTNPSPAHRRTILLRLGSDAGSTGNYSLAIASFKAASKISPGEDDTIIMALAWDYVAAGDKPDGLIYMKKYAQILSTNNAPGSSSELANVNGQIKELSQ